MCPRLRAALLVDVLLSLTGLRVCPLRLPTSTDLLLATDRIARYDWTLPEVQELHREFSRAMKAENKHLAGLDEVIVA